MQVIKTIASLLLLTFLMPLTVHGQNITAIELEKDLATTWIVRISGDDRTRTLKINRVSQKSDGAFSLDAEYGYTTQYQRSIEGEIQQNLQERKLIITTPTSSRIVAIESPQGSFIGTFESKKGETSEVTIEKISQSELEKLRDVETIAKKTRIKKPSARAPESFAVFSGAWSGTFERRVQDFSLIKIWIWIHEVKANGDVTFSFSESDTPVTPPRKSRIVDGTFEWPCADGICSLKPKGDRLVLDFTSQYGINYAYMERVK